jgi:dipeptidyl aminopeptidase/acylaminoacyl peptidase
MDTRRLFVVIATLSIALGGCATAPTHPSLEDAALPKLIPLRDFFLNLDANYNYQVSPDGKKVAWLAVNNRRVTVFFRSLDDEAIESIDSHSPRNINHFAWLQDSTRIVFLQDQFGNENHHLYLVNTARPHARPVDLTPLANAKARLHRVIHTDPEHILIEHNQRDATVFDLYRLAPATGALERVAQNPGDVVRWVSDRHGQLRARVRKTPADRWLLDVQTASGWRPLLEWSFDEQVELLAFAPDDRGAWTLSNRGRDRVGLVRLDLETGAEQLVYQDPSGVDLASVLVSDVSQQPVLALAMPGYPTVHYFDAAAERELGALPRPSRSGLRVVSASYDERVVVVSVYTDNTVAHRLLDRDRGSHELLGEHPLARHADALLAMEPVSFPSRDGLGLHGYLTRPAGVNGRLPTVLKVHGGPWARDQWGLDGTVQFLANRGYAVLQVNYRGSTGYGKAFMQAAIGEFAGKMHTDLLDAVQWAVDRGITDPNRICIYGGSYGGYATLVGMTFTPEVFACGVDVVGPSNLVTLTQSVPQYWKPWMPFWYRYVGDPNDPKDQAEMERRSPLFKVDEVKRPLLIVQGANDPRVTQRESDQMVAALRAAGKDVEYMLFPDEGHGIQHWKNRLRFHRRLEDFLAQHLGGRSAGFDYFELGLVIF